MNYISNASGLSVAQGSAFFGHAWTNEITPFKAVSSFSLGQTASFTVPLSGLFVLQTKANYSCALKNLPAFNANNLICNLPCAGAVVDTQIALQATIYWTQEATANFSVLYNFLNVLDNILDNIDTFILVYCTFVYSVGRYSVFKCTLYLKGDVSARAFILDG